MRTKDYSKEIGYQTEQRTVPLSVGIAVVATILLGGSVALYAARPAEKAPQVAKAPAPIVAAADPAGK